MKTDTVSAFALPIGMGLLCAGIYHVHGIAGIVCLIGAMLVLIATTSR